MHNHMTCPLCKSQGNNIFSSCIRKKYTIQYYKCESCELIFTESPYWLNEAYSETNLSFDTGAIVRNIYNQIKVKTILNKHFSEHKNFLDFGGGYGIFTRMMRDAGYNFLWYDKYAQNAYTEGFSWNGEKIDLLVCFEVFEHMDNPSANIDELFNIADDIIFSTELYTNPNYPDSSWGYYSHETGQHISFYNRKTMEYLAMRYHVNWYTISGLHIFTHKNLSPAMILELEQEINSSILTFSEITGMHPKHSTSDFTFLKDKYNEKV